jgi:hypothetical protein
MSTLTEKLLGRREVRESESFQPHGVIIANGLFASERDNSWNVCATRWIAQNKPCDAASFYYREGLLRLGHGRHVEALVYLHLAEHDKAPNGKQDAWGHSNGAATQVEALLSILDQSYGGEEFVPEQGETAETFIDDLWLIAPYMSPDCRLHINRLIASKMVKRVLVLVSRNDTTVGWSWFRKWTMGRDGVQNAVPPAVEYKIGALPAPDAIKGQIIVIRDDTKTHCGWIDPAPHDEFGFNQQTIDMILSISAPATVSAVV